MCAVQKVGKIANISLIKYKIRGFFHVRKLFTMHLNSVVLELQASCGYPKKSLYCGHSTNREGLIFRRNLRESLICRNCFPPTPLLVNSATFVSKNPQQSNQTKNKPPLFPPWSCGIADACPLLSYTLHHLQGAFVRGGLKRRKQKE